MMMPPFDTPGFRIAVVADARGAVFSDQRAAGLIESLLLPTLPFTDAFGCLASHSVALTRSAPGSAPVTAMLPVTRDVARANVTSPLTRTSPAKRVPCRTILPLRSVNVPPRRPRPFLPPRRHDGEPAACTVPHATRARRRGYLPARRG